MRRAGHSFTIRHPAKANTSLRPSRYIMPSATDFSLAELLQVALELDNDLHREDKSAQGPERPAKRQAKETPDVEVERVALCRPAIPPLNQTSSVDVQVPSKKLTHTPREDVEEGEVVEGNSRTAKNKGRRAKKRKTDAERSFEEKGHQVRKEVFDLYIRDVPSTALKVDLVALPASSCGYQAKPNGAVKKASAPKLDSLLLEGYSLEHWDGE
jgi:hypothetical protein